MRAVQQIIRILVIIILADHARCQDGYDNRDMVRYQQMAESDVVPYSTNILHRDPDNQAIRTNIQFQLIEDGNKNDYNRADRSRKVYRIKNPFQNNQEENKQQNEVNSDAPDVGTAASNQYGSMQYSLPPEEFLQQMRAENQYYQQQQTTPSPNLGYTATPQPQYQYSTIGSGSYDPNQQSIQQVESKSQSQYVNNNAYQFNPTNTFHFDNVQSTPSPVTTYLSTSLPNSQYVGTPNNYVSSSSPIFLSSPPNLQSYVSSPLSVIQTGTPDYNGNRVTTTIGNNALSFDNNDQLKKMQIDHYDNSANGIRYPVHQQQQQYSNEYGSSTPSSLDVRDSWQNTINAGVSPISKSMQEVSVTQYQNYPYSNNQQEGRPDTNLDANGDTHRIGNLASANNIYLNYAQPDYQGYNNGKSRTRDAERDIGQPDYYSNGEYGWKLGGRKPQIDNDIYSSASSGNYQRYQSSLPNNGAAVSQMTFHMDTSRSNNYDQIPKSSSDSTVAQEFAKAAANAHEYMKQQQSYYGNNNYANSYNNNPTSYNSNPFYGNIEKDKIKYIDSSTPSPYTYSSQPDLITSSSPFYYGRENNIENKPKQPFDHAKALKAIVPIDVSNVVSNSEPQLKGGLDNRYSVQNYVKDQVNQNQQVQYRPLTDSYYKDKNSYYGLNIKSKPDEYLTDNLKQYDTINSQYILKPQQTQESLYNQGSYGSGQQRVSYNPQQNYQENVPSPSYQQGPQRPNIQPDSINSILKLNDVPYQLTQALSPESFKFQNNDYDHGNLPTSLPVRINQDVSSHQLEVTSNILNKLLLNKAPFNNRPDVDPQASSGISMINGFKVANPFNMDLKMVADMLKGKSNDNLNIMSMRDQYNKPSPLKFDLAQLQMLLKNENIGNIIPVNDGLAALTNPFLDVYNSGRFPYQGVKYSRSQEEEEDTIVPIADASHNHPIGAVTEQDDEHESTGGSDTSAQDEEGLTNYEKNGPKKPYLSGHRTVRDRHRHANSLIPGRHAYPRKYPNSEVDEPYPLLKPPPPHSPRNRGSHFKTEKHSRRRRVKPRVFRILKTEALYESENEGQPIEKSMPTLLRPPAPVAEDKSDDTANIEESS